MKHENNTDHETGMMHSAPDTGYRLSDFLPLIILLDLIAVGTLAHQLWFGWDINQAMRIIMALFFLIFGTFKLINLKGFAQAYSMYDLLAKRFFAYGYMYPFIELALGLAYLFSWQLGIVNVITIVVMLFSAAGVFIELRKGSTITCACLGTLFKIPMTYVTLAEDLIMAAMALAMLIFG